LAPQLGLKEKSAASQAQIKRRAKRFTCVRDILRTTRETAAETKERFSMKYIAMGIASIGLCGFAGAAEATAVTLDFDAFQQGEEVGSFYTGGHGSLGTGPGPDLGITFESFNGGDGKVPLGCQTPCFLGNDNSKIGKALEITPPGFAIHTPLGFSGTVEFDAAQQSGKKALFDVETSEQVVDPPPPIEGPVIDNSAQNPPGCGLQECGFVHYSLTLDPGVVGLEINFFTFFTGMGGDFLFIDNLHFSDLTLPADTPPEAVPEPASWIVTISGLGLLGLTLRRRRRPCIEPDRKALGISPAPAA
jgi:hypothetical protein